MPELKPPTILAANAAPVILMLGCLVPPTGAIAKPSVGPYNMYRLNRHKYEYPSSYGSPAASGSDATVPWKGLSIEARGLGVVADDRADPGVVAAAGAVMLRPPGAAGRSSGLTRIPVRTTANHTVSEGTVYSHPNSASASYIVKGWGDAHSLAVGNRTLPTL